jgi:ribonuclease HI
LSERVIAYTDGGCVPNPGPGGWGVILLFRESARFLSGYASESTNNKMELTAATSALKALTKDGVDLELHTDSMYVKDGMQKWIHNWRARNWKTADKKPVKNREYWEELDRLTLKHHVDWNWVKGHDVSRYNNFVDWLATDAIDNRKGRDQKGPIDKIERFIDQALKSKI